MVVPGHEGVPVRRAGVLGHLIPRLITIRGRAREGSLLQAAGGAGAGGLILTPDVSRDLCRYFIFNAVAGKLTAGSRPGAGSSLKCEKLMARGRAYGFQTHEHISGARQLPRRQRPWPFAESRRREVLEAGLPRPDRASRLSRSLEALTLRYRVALVTAVSSRRLPAAAVLAGVPSERRVGWPGRGIRT